jgi:AraC-like DNA-binding protein
MTTFYVSTADELADVASRSFVPMSVASVSPAFRGSIERYELGGGVVVSRVLADPCDLRRTRGQVAAFPCENLLFEIQSSGVGHVRQDGRSATISHGSGVLYSHVKPSELDFPTPNTSLTLQLPRRRLALSDSAIADVALQPVTAASAALRVYTGLVSSVLRESPAPAPAVEAMAEAALDLLAGMLTTHLDGRPGRLSLSTNEAMLAAMCRYVKENLGDPGLCVARMAERHGISERRVHRLFASIGESPAAYVRARRLEWAARLLTGPSRNRTMMDIALWCGFCDLGTFTRAFKRRYGAPPAEWRAVQVVVLPQA